jgi:hypothetical protein
VPTPVMPDKVFETFKIPSIAQPLDGVRGEDQEEQQLAVDAEGNTFGL